VPQIHPRNTVQSEQRHETCGTLVEIQLFQEYLQNHQQCPDRVVASIKTGHRRQQNAARDPCSCGPRVWRQDHALARTEEQQSQIAPGVHRVQADRGYRKHFQQTVCQALHHQQETAESYKQSHDLYEGRRSPQGTPPRDHRVRLLHR